MLTFREFKTGPAKRVAAVVPSSDEFRDLTNDAVRQLMQRGNWWATVQPMRGCVYDNCVVWPRQVASVLAVDSCGHPVPIWNHWWSFVPWDVSHTACAVNHERCGYRGNVSIVNDGLTPVFNPITCGTGMYLQFYPSVPSDVNKRIVVYGIDDNGQTIHGQRADKTWQDGVEVLLSIPYAQTTIKIRRVDRIVKDKTNGVVRAYQWDGTSINGSGGPLLYDLASYEGSETSPEYLHSRLTGGKCCGTCNSIRQISALVKLAYVEIQNDDDLVLIDNADAVRDFMMSIREKEAGNTANSNALELSAFRELNYQIRNRVPLEQTVVSFRPYGSADLSRITGGMI